MTEIEIEELKNKLKKLDISYKSENDAIEHQYKINAAHPHNEILWRFINSKYYDINVFDYYKIYFNKNTVNVEDESWLKLQNKIREKNKQDIINQDKKIINKGVTNLERNDLLPYIEFLNVQLAIETIHFNQTPPIMYCRHGIKGISLIMNNIDYAFYMIKKLDECNKNKNWDEIIKLDWNFHKHVISLGWALYENGLGEYTIKLLEPFYETIKIFIENKNLDEINILNKFFEYEIFGQRPYHRMITTISFALGMSYLQVGNIKKYLDVLKLIINYEKIGNNGLYYRLNTRHLEAAIRIYEKEKNEENLEKIYIIFNNAINIKPSENSESLMERCIVMYDFLYKIIDMRV